MTSNSLRTAALMAVLITLFALIGAAIGGESGLLFAFAFAVLMNFGSYWFSDKIVLKMYRGREVTAETAPELYAMVDRLRQRAGLPMPRVYITPGSQPNAFATGRNPQNAAVAFTEGILRLLPREELEGVAAHELAHIKNRDILTSSIAATLGSAITLLARFAIFVPQNRDNGGGGGLQALLMLILAPIAAMIIQMAISRSREFAADKLGAEIAGNPDGLANALLRLER
ncbi:MAG: M48 family metalloprotease, partial [Rubricoccaceae bacterium]